MSKPKPTRIPSDGCIVRVTGEIYHPHEGEWAELVPARSVGEERTLVKFRRILAELDGIRGEPDEVAKSDALLDQHYGEVCEHLSRRVFAWNWTDDFGSPLPQPAGKPEVFLALREGELAWLLYATGNETAEERKNA